jgi:hypothetical protein
MEFVDLLSLVLVAILAIFVAATVRLCLPAMVVLVGTWRRPSEGEDFHLATFLGGQTGGLVCFR